MASPEIRSYLKRFGVVFIVIWTVIIGFLTAISLNSHHNATIKEANDEARDYFRLNLFYRAWASKMGGVYAPVDKIVPNKYLQVPDRDITTSDNRQMTLVNPAYMTRMVFESIISSSPDPVISKITSLKPLNPVNAPDEWERQNLAAFDRHEYEENSEITSIDGNPYLRFISQFVTDESCLKCHAHQGYRAGDVRGAIVISVPLAKRLAIQRENDRHIFGGYFLLWVLGTAGIAITSRRRTLDVETMRANEQKFRNICDWTQDWEYWLGPDDTMKYVSPSCLEITGYTPQDFMEDKELVIRIVHPDYRPGFAEHHSASVTEPDCASSELEFQIITRSGRVRWIQHLCRPIFSENVYLGRRASNKDITDRKLAEEKISRLSAIVEYSDDAVISKTLDGIVTSWNRGAEKLFGYSEEEMLGQSLHKLFPPERQDEEEFILKAITSGKRIEHIETVRVCKDGRRINVSVTISPIRDQKGAIVGVSKIARDITERKQAEEERAKLEDQLQQALKLESVGRLAGGVAHDFNNMLGVIIGHTELALLETPPDHPISSSLEEIKNAAARSADLTRQLLAFARKQTIAPRVLDLNETVAGMLKMLQRLIGEDIDLVWQPASDLGLVKMDPSQIDQILANLCVNARDAISGVGRITIKTEDRIVDKDYLALHLDAAPGEYVTLTVSDNGCGIDRETMSHIFEPFFTTKSVGKGSGLGLATVFGAVKQNSGFINIYSEPGLGATFTIYLPRHLGKMGKTSLEGASMPIRRGQETILLVEDELAILNMTATILEKQGYRLLKASTPAEAMRHASDHSDMLRLLIADVIMPEMNGKDLAQKLKEHCPHLKCLFMSGYTADAIAKRGVLDDGVNFIQKPFTLPAITTKVREVLDNN